MTSRENMNFEKNFNFWEMSLNQFMRPVISREMRIPWKCYFMREFEYPGKLEYLGNVSLPSHGLARYTA